MKISTIFLGRGEKIDETLKGMSGSQRRLHLAITRFFVEKLLFDLLTPPLINQLFEHLSNAFQK